MIYEFDAYRFADEPPLVRIGRKGTRPLRTTEYVHDTLADSVQVQVLELRLDWSWTEPVEVTLGGDLAVSVTPHTASGGAPRRGFYGLMAWGRCSAFIRRWGATLPLDMLDARVIAGLKAREEMEQMLWLVQRGSDR